MFDFSLAELIVVAAVALIVMGPKELITAFRGFGRAVYRIRSFCSSIWSEIEVMVYNEDVKEINEKIKAMHEEHEAKEKKADSGK